MGSATPRAVSAAPGLLRGFYWRPRTRVGFLMAPDPRLVQAIRKIVPRPYQPLLLATTLVESGGRLNAVGDNGQSFGPYQEYSQGRGAGIAPAQRQDPFASTTRAWREFQSLSSRFSGPELAYRAQRPADRAGYIRKVSAALPQAQRILGGGRGGPVETAAPVTSRNTPAGRRAGPAGGAPTGGGGVSPDAAALVLRYAQESEQDVLAGRAPRPIDPILPELANLVKQTAPAAEAPTPRGNAPRGGHSAGDGHDHGPNSSVPLSGPVGGFTRGGGPEDHGRRALGNWQSDNAYDIMGKAGQPVYAPVGGQVVKVSGQPGGDPGFAGYGITVRTAQGDLFFKHLGSTPLKVGSRITPGSLVGTLDAKTAGGPHLHLGGTNRRLLDQLYARYVGGR